MHAIPTNTPLRTTCEYLPLNLTQIVFSRAESYLAMSLRDSEDARPWEQRSGEYLYIRTVRGDRETDRVFHVEAIEDGAPAAFAIDAAPHILRLKSRCGTVEFCMTGTGSIRVRGTGNAALRLTLVRPGTYGNAQPYDREGRWLVNAWGARMNYLLTPIAGRLNVDSPAVVMRAEKVVVEFSPVDGNFEALIEEFAHERISPLPSSPFDDEALDAWRDFEAFRSKQAAPEEMRQAADMMAYVQWSSLVAPSGHLTRPAMLMSKNHMTSLWSWDHCFNAIALMPHSPELAWDQFMLPFDHQDASGALPDFVNDKVIGLSFTKPPIHGWTLSRILECAPDGFVTEERLLEIYQPLSKWTRWWLTYRDQDGDGIPNYNHGNDSGWDNSTAFDAGFPVESPDLCAYIILQMDALAEIAHSLGRSGDSESWTAEANAILARLMEHSWRGGRFVAPRSMDHQTVSLQDGDSLLPYLTLVLGDRLPATARRLLIDGLLKPGRFLTEFGLATESVSSPRYEPDGYWRGPIWAPPVMLITDGLRRLGEEAAARTIAERFCRTISQSGSAENFDARTGAGLRDRAYTWTASVFLILCRSYL